MLSKFRAFLSRWRSVVGFVAVFLLSLALGWITEQFLSKEGLEGAMAAQTRLNKSVDNFSPWGLWNNFWSAANGRPSNATPEELKFIADCELTASTNAYLEKLKKAPSTDGVGRQTPPPQLLDHETWVSCPTLPAHLREPWTKSLPKIAPITYPIAFLDMVVDIVWQSGWFATLIALGELALGALIFFFLRSAVFTGSAGWAELVAIPLGILLCGSLAALAIKWIAVGALAIFGGIVSLAYSFVTGSFVAYALWFFGIKATEKTAGAWVEKTIGRALGRN
jgi:hypothetical protein